MSAMRPFRAPTLAIIALLSLVPPALAGEPRPWLCRDKPAFSDSHPMQYQASAKGGGEWQIFFMQFVLNAAHDGFSITKSQTLSSSPQTGTLPSGQYYAVILHRQGSAWVCTYGDEQSRAPGVVKNLCYSTESGPDCQASLLVKSQSQ
jgi:hypothetical protein